MIARSNRSLVTRLLLVSASMFVFGVFAMPPLYAKFCEVTGIGQAAIRIAEEPVATGPAGRKVRLLFDANTQSALLWNFKPVERSLIVNVGEASEARYEVTNLLDQPSSGRAVYNVTPPEAARYFVKTECFCFSNQQLQAGEHREMPVRFYVEPGLPPDITEMTLSYTFFENQASANPEQVAQTTIPETD